MEEGFARRTRACLPAGRRAGSRVLNKIEFAERKFYLELATESLIANQRESVGVFVFYTNPLQFNKSIIQYIKIKNL
jgi:hypothetical protein